MSRPSPGRFPVFLACVAVVFGLLLARLFFLQVCRGAHYAEVALANITYDVRQNPPRGRILDRDGVILAGNRASFTLALVDCGPEATPPDIGELSRLTGLPAADLTLALEGKELSPVVPTVIARDLDPAACTRIAEELVSHPGLVLGWEAVRTYPLGPAAAHLTGYTGAVGEEDVETWPGVYAPGDRRGLTGVEAACDWLLRGHPGAVTYRVDASGRPLDVLTIDPARPGLDVRLTIDARLQQVSYDSLGESMRRVRERSGGRFGAAAGAVVALDPTTGAVLVLVSRPSYDPHLFAFGARTGVLDALLCDEAEPLLNRATHGLYAPGSTFKMVTAAAALEEGVTTPDEVLVCRAVHPRIPKKCWRSDGHGPVRLREAVMGSCNVYFYEMGLRLGIDRLASYARALGLGRPVGFDLDAPRGPFGPGITGPGETARTGKEGGRGEEPEWGPAGTLPDAAWKAAVFPGEPTVWPAEVMDAAIGEGFHAHTPLHMAVVASMVAGAGTAWRPYVIDSVLDEEGQVITQATPERLPDPGVSEETWRIVREALRAAVMEPGGTGAGVFGPEFSRRWGIDVAGKTGTHERPPGSGRADDGWFVCFAPYDDPKIVIVVVVEEGGSGSGAAAPVARAIIEAWLQTRQSGNTTDSSP